MLLMHLLLKKAEKSSILLKNDQDIQISTFNHHNRLHYRRKLCALCLSSLSKITADFEPRYLGEKRDRAFLKIQLKSLWNYTSGDAQ